MNEEEALIINQIFGDLQDAEADAPPRQLYNASDPFVNMKDAQFVGLFRVSKVLANEIITWLTPHMNQGQNYCSLEIKTKVTYKLVVFL